MQWFDTPEIRRFAWVFSGLILLWLILTLAPDWAPGSLSRRGATVALSFSVHVNATRLCLLLEAMIFVIGWQAFGNARRMDSLILAVTFLSAALLDFLYLSQMPGTQVMFQHAQAGAAMLFWMAARLITSAGVLLSLAVPGRRTVHPRVCAATLASVLAAVLGFTWLVAANWSGLPDLDADQRSAPALVCMVSRSLAMTAGFLCAVGGWRERRRAAAVSATPFVTALKRVDIGAACAALAMSETCVSLLHLHGPLITLVSPIFKLIAAVFFFRAILFCKISAPYAALKATAMEHRNAEEKIHRSHEELSRLSVALQSLRETERRDIARDLNEDLGQLLAAVRIEVSLLQSQAHQAVCVPSAQLDKIDSLLNQSIGSLRRIATDLRPRALDEGGLYYALQNLRRTFEEHHGIDCHLMAGEQDLILDDLRTTALYRIAQEALENVRRHADATIVQIKLQRRAGYLELLIQDDGRGIRPEELTKSAGFGLVDMRERVRTMGGKLNISGEAQRGTRIDIIIPLADMAA